MRRWIVVALLAGCGQARSEARSDDREASPTPTARVGTVVDLPGEGTGLYWDASASTLFVTDATHGALVAWTRELGFRSEGQLPTMRELGGLVRLSDGRFATPAYGAGSDGGVLVIESPG